MQILNHCEELTKNCFARILMVCNLTLKFCIVIDIDKVVYQPFALPIQQC